VGIGVALWQAREAQAQRVQAEGLIEYMIGDLRKKLQPVGRLDVLDGVGDKALAYYAAQNLNSLDADSLGRRARALHMIGDLAERRGKLEEAQRNFQQAADTTSELLQRHPNDAQRIFDQSQSEYYLGYIQWLRGHLHEAEAAFKRYYVMAQRMNQIVPNNHDWQLEKVFAAQNVAIVLLDLGQADEALALSKQARAEIDAIAREHPEDAVSESNTIGWSARAENASGHDEQAIAAENDKVAAARRAPGADKDQDVRFLVANAHVEIAYFMCNLGRLDESLQTVRAGIAELTALDALDPSNTDFQSELVGARMTEGSLLAERGDIADARITLATATTTLDRLMARSTIPKRSWRLTGRGRIVTLRAQLASTPEETAAANLALSNFLADVAKYEREGSEISAEDAIIIAAASLTQGDTLVRMGHPEAAGPIWQAAASRLRPQAEHMNPAAMTWLGQIDLRLDSTQDARAWADRVLGTTYRHPAFADLRKQLGQAQTSGQTP
jgi:tetratricopeptide (TPR) repeat protein